MMNMNKLNPNNLLHKKKDTAAEEDPVAVAVEKANQEKEEMKKQYETKIQAVEKQADSTRIVMQAMVLVARLSPKEFFKLLDDEGENWTLEDLKYIATAINDKLKEKHEASGQPDGESTAQKLYSYSLMDPKAVKTTVIQVISELHKELSSLEGEKESTGAAAAGKIVVEDVVNSSSLRKDMALLEEVMLENEKLKLNESVIVPPKEEKNLNTSNVSSSSSRAASTKVEENDDNNDNLITSTNTAAAQSERTQDMADGPSQAAI